MDESVTFLLRQLLSEKIKSKKEEHERLVTPEVLRHVYLRHMANAPFKWSRYDLPVVNDINQLARFADHFRAWPATEKQDLDHLNALDTMLTWARSPLSEVGALRHAPGETVDMQRMLLHRIWIESSKGDLPKDAKPFYDKLFDQQTCWKEFDALGRDRSADEGLAQRIIDMGSLHQTKGMAVHWMHGKFKIIHAEHRALVAEQKRALVPPSVLEWAWEAVEKINQAKDLEGLTALLLEMPYSRMYNTCFARTELVTRRLLKAVRVILLLKFDELTA